MLKERDIGEICELNSLALQCRSTAEFENDVLAAIKDCFSLSVSTLSCRSDVLEGVPYKVAFCGGRADATTEYSRFYRHLSNPYRQHFSNVARVGEAAIIDTQDVFEPEELRKSSKLFREFQEPMGMERSIAIVLSSRPGNRAMLGLWRQHRTPAFDARDKAKAQLMAPILARTYARLHEDRSHDRFAWMLHAIEPVVLTVPIVLLNESGEISFANSQALELFPTLEVGQSGYALYAASSRQSHAEALRPGHPLRLTVKSTSWTMRSLQIPESYGGGALTYFVSDQLEADPLEKLARLGLTSREIAVAEATAQGLANKEIARKLGISYFTVQDHMKSIFRKLNMNSRVKLTNLVLDHQGQSAMVS